MPLNTRRGDILQEVAHLNLIPEASRPRKVNTMMGRDARAWYSYHRLRGHHTDECLQLKKEIEQLIQKVHLLTYVKDGKSHLVKETFGELIQTRKDPPKRRGRV